MTLDGSTAKISGTPDTAQSATFTIQVKDANGRVIGNWPCSKPPWAKLVAINANTGDIAWEVPQPGAARAKTWSGVLATAGGLIFYGQPNGGFAAVDQGNGKALWHFPTNVRMKASPMTFAVVAVKVEGCSRKADVNGDLEKAAREMDTGKEPASAPVAAQPAPSAPSSQAAPAADA